MESDSPLMSIGISDLLNKFQTGNGDSFNALPDLVSTNWTISINLILKIILIILIIYIIYKLFISGSCFARCMSHKTKSKKSVTTPITNEPTQNETN